MTNVIQPVIIEKLDSEQARRQIIRLTELISLIPEVEYISDDVIRVEKPDGRQMHDKWEHSYVATAEGEDKILGVIFGYKRGTENSELYPHDTFYIAEIAVDPAVQGRGIARRLLTRYHQDSIKEAEDLGIGFSVQTNSAQWNEGVKKLYELFGYTVVGQKVYDNRVDFVMRASANAVRKALDDNHTD